MQSARQNIVDGELIDLIGFGAPRWQHVLTVNLDREQWLTTLSHRYRRGYTDLSPLPDGSLRRVASYQLWDLQQVVPLAPDVRLLLGVQNLLNTDPPFSNASQFGYIRGYTDPRGRRWTVGLRATWP